MSLKCTFECNIIPSRLKKRNALILEALKTWLMSHEKKAPIKGRKV
jgi:hypothetical protein